MGYGWLNDVSELPQMFVDSVEQNGFFETIGNLDSAVRPAGQDPIGTFIAPIFSDAFDDVRNFFNN